jgi:hypothetical protein
MTNEELVKKVEDLTLEIERLKAVHEIQNVLGWYVNYHSASMQEETCTLFALKTPGVRCIFNGNIYEGREGIERHFLGLLKESEKDLRGRLFVHDLVTPVIEVAADGQSAKSVWSTIGCESNLLKDGSLQSLWNYGKYRFDFVKEDGKWKIYRLYLHGCYNTPFEGKGWTDDPFPCEHANQQISNWDPRWAPDGKTKVPTKHFRVDSAECDLHSMIPAPPVPYDTWDEGIECNL